MLRHFYFLGLWYRKKNEKKKSRGSTKTWGSKHPQIINYRKGLDWDLNCDMLVYLLKTSLLPTLFFFLWPRMSFNYPKAFEKKTDVTSWSFYWAMSSRDRGGKLGAMSLKAREGFTKKCISSHLALTLITWYFSNLKCLYNLLCRKKKMFAKKTFNFHLSYQFLWM